MEFSLHNFLKCLESFEISLSEEQVKQFLLFYELMIEKNKVMNLTGITEWEDVVQKHFLDSLSLVRVVNIGKVESMIDVGTGAGFPGIPLKIAFPHLKLVLMDSLNKRVRFLEEVVEKCRMDNVEAVHSRAEDLARKGEYREKFDVCVSRAVANLSSLSEYCLPFVKVGGQFVSYKSGSVEEEMKEAGRAIGILGGKVEKTEKFYLPDSEISRALVVVNKVKNCGRRYPRKAGMAANHPL